MILFRLGLLATVIGLAACGADGEPEPPAQRAAAAPLVAGPGAVLVARSL